MKSIKISVLGLGVIGSQLMEYIRKNLDDKKGGLGSATSIDKVYIRDIMKKRNIDTDGLRLTDNPYEAVKDADIVIDCMGGNGTELTRKLILEAIYRKKAVIMSSKKCLALYGKEITEAAVKYGVSFRYDATVGGGIPISGVLEHMGKCEEIRQIYGICNATSNFILGEMQRDSSYETALEKAQACGYAENNPDDDVDGFDAMYKAVIMTGFGMRHWLDCREIQPVSLKNVSVQDIKDAGAANRILKPVFNIINNGEDYICSVGPRAVSSDSILAAVKGNNNMIVICGSESGERAFYGQGAGAKPTSSAMYDDLVKTIQELRRQ